MLQKTTRRTFTAALAAAFGLSIVALPAQAKRIPTGQVNLTTTDHLAVVFEGGRQRLISASAGYDPKQRKTAASHIKFLTALVSFEILAKTPQRNTSQVQALLTASLVKSDNKATTELAITLAGSEAAFISLMQAKAQQLRLTSTIVANSSGDPQQRQGIRWDSYTSAADMLVIVGELEKKHMPALQAIYSRISPQLRPTSSLFYPLSYRHKTPDPVLMFSKTATDKYQYGSQIVVARMGGKTYVVQHTHLDRTTSSSAVTADILLQIFAKEGIRKSATNSDYFNWLESIATGKRQPLPTPSTAAKRL